MCVCWFVVDGARNVCAIFMSKATNTNYAAGSCIDFGVCMSLRVPNQVADRMGAAGKHEHIAGQPANACVRRTLQSSLWLRRRRCAALTDWKSLRIKVVHIVHAVTRFAGLAQSSVRRVHQCHEIVFKLFLIVPVGARARARRNNHLPKWHSAEMPAPRGCAILALATARPPGRCRCCSILIKT